MLNPDPKARITIAEIRKHRWINDGYDVPPASMITARQPVFEVRDEIINQLAGLGFKNEDEIRKQILDNECCQVVAMYHLILDRKVAEEMAEVKKNLLDNKTISISDSLRAPLPATPNVKTSSKIVNMKAKKPGFLL